jgi:hypothetical protein
MLDWLILGGGIHGVHIVSRHEPRERQFDSDPGWLGPKLMRGFERERSLERRRALIVGARHRGSMPREIFGALNRAIGAKHRRSATCR